LLNLETWTWTQPEISAEISDSRSFHTAVLFQDKMIVWGGYKEAKEGGYTFTDVAVHILDLKTWQWSQVTPKGTPPEPRSHHSVALFQDKLFIDGGFYDIYATRDDIHLLDLTKMCWINIQVDNCSSAALAGFKVRGNRLIKFLGDAAYGGFCQDILTLELGDFDYKKQLKFQWHKGKFKGIDNYKYQISGLESEEDDDYEEENVIPCRTIHGYGEFGDNLVLFAGMAPGNGVSHMTIGDLVLLNLPAVGETTNETYTAVVPQVEGKFPPPRFGHSTIQFDHQMIVYGGLWIDTEEGNHSYDNDVYILETL
jgi:Kelch motif